MQNGLMWKLSSDHIFVHLPGVVYNSIPCYNCLLSRVVTNKFTKLSCDSK